MDKCKQLTILISCLSSILTSALLLLELQAVIVLKIAQQQSHLRHLQNEAILSRNNALARYRSVRKRFALFTFKKMCKIATLFSMYLFKKINVFCYKIYLFITVIFILFVINLFLYFSIKKTLEKWITV